jgi:hypothetical protein
MEKLAIYLTVTFFTTLLYKPTRISNVWSATIISLLVTLVIIILYYSIFRGAFFAGQAISASMIPLLVSGALLFFHLKEKMKRDKYEFPIVLALFSLIAWGIAFYIYYQEIKMNQFFMEHPEFIP